MARCMVRYIHCTCMYVTCTARCIGEVYTLYMHVRDVRLGVLVRYIHCTCMYVMYG